MITELDNPTPNDARTTALQHLGTEIRHTRETAGLTRHQLGAHAHLTYSTITKIENGHRFCHLHFAELCDFLFPHTHGRFTRLWHHVANHPATPGPIRTYLDLEAAADEIRVHHPHAIPDLAQTPEYTHALLRPARLPDTEQIVKARQRRQQTLVRDEPPQLWIILDETALTRTVGTATVMAAQLQHLLTIAENPRHRVQILHKGTTPARHHPFTLLTFRDSHDRHDSRDSRDSRDSHDIVLAHGFPRGHLTAAPEDTDTARSAFALITAEAAAPGAAPHLIHTALKHYL